MKEAMPPGDRGIKKKKNLMKGTNHEEKIDTYNLLKQNRNFDHQKPSRGRKKT